MTQSASPAPARGTLRVALVGHVDHGKSTIVGRLLNDTGSLAEGKVAAVEAMCKRRGMPFEWSFVTDALTAERDQALTVDASHIVYRADGRDYVLIDAPGHHEFLKNMITGAAGCDAAVVVIDAAEGVREQSRSHAYLLYFLGVDEVIVAVNKMDQVDFDQRRFGEIEALYGDYLERIGITPKCFIPMAAQAGENIAHRGGSMAWYRGPVLAEALGDLTPPNPPVDLPLRLPVQDVYKFDGSRIIAGRIESGRLGVGDRIVFSPSNKTGTVRSIEAWNAPETVIEAEAGSSVGFIIEEQFFIERGDVVSHETDLPSESNEFRARLFWLGKEPLRVGKQLLLKSNTAQTPAYVRAIDHVIDTDDLSLHPADTVGRNDLAEIVLRTQSMLALDAYRENAATGRFMLIDNFTVVGGVTAIEGFADERAALMNRPGGRFVVEHRITAEARAQRAGHSGAVFWLTGLSAAGKSTIAIEAENRLFQLGFQVYVLDGDNIRRGLAADLGFSHEDRTENIRRAGEVAALFAEAGFIVISAFISPYREDRERARAAAGEGAFHEVYVKASLEACEERDPKGLYKRARAGEIADFTGIGAPYEEPERSELTIDTEKLGPKEAVDAFVDYCRQAVSVEGRRSETGG